MLKKYKYGSQEEMFGIFFYLLFLPSHKKFRKHIRRFKTAQAAVQQGVF